MVVSPKREEPGLEDAPWKELRADLSEIAAELRKLALLRWERTRLAASEGAFGLAFAAFGALAAAVATSVAAALFVIGLSGALTALAGGRSWVGQLAGGAIVLGGGVLLLHVGHRRFQRAFVRRLEAELGGPEPAPRTDGGSKETARS